MTHLVPPQIVAEGLANVRQGDVLGLSALPLVADGGGIEHVPTPAGVVVISQTCDAVQASKLRCHLAPVLVEPTTSTLDNARKGRSPLHLYLGDDEALWPPIVADLGSITSVPKRLLVGAPITQRFSRGTSHRDAHPIADRIGRAFTRFPFPDDLYPAFQKLRERVQHTAGSTASPVGQALDLALDLRVSATQWDRSPYTLRLWLVVPDGLIAPADDWDPGWTTDRIKGWSRGDDLSALPLARACELVVLNVDGDRTSLARLWHSVAEGLSALIPQTPARSGALSHEKDRPAVVISVDSEVVAESEFSYRQMRESESLDLEAVSLASPPADSGVVV